MAALETHTKHIVTRRNPHFQHDSVSGGVCVQGASRISRKMWFKLGHLKATETLLHLKKRKKNHVVTVAKHSHSQRFLFIFIIFFTLPGQPFHFF